MIFLVPTTMYDTIKYSSKFIFDKLTPGELETEWGREQMWFYIYTLFYCSIVLFFLLLVQNKIGQLNLRYNFNKFQKNGTKIETEEKSWRVQIVKYKPY